MSETAADIPFLIIPFRPARPAQGIARNAPAPLAAPRDVGIATVQVGLTRTTAPWLTSVHQRIFDSVSIVPTDTETDNDGSWLTLDTAAAAILFLSAVSDVLPSEPYIYASRTRDLIAEFKASRGRLTAVISPTSVRLFALPDDGEPTEKPLTLGASSRNALRAEVQKLTERVLTSRNGATVGS